MNIDYPRNLFVNCVRNNPHTNLSENSRAMIVGLHQGNVRHDDIARIMHCHPKTVRRWVNRFNEFNIQGLNDHRKNNFGPRKTEREEDVRIIEKAERSPFTATRKIINELELDISVKTVTRRLREVN